MVRGPIHILGVIAILLASSGRETADTNPAFQSTSVEVAPGPCPEGSLCIEVRAPVDGTEKGRGVCRLFGRGDPDDLEPIIVSDDLEMIPGEVTVWRVEVPVAVEVDDLNPVCTPMAEG